VTLLNAVRWGLPGGMILVGVVLMVLFGGDAEAAGIVLVGSGVLVALAGALLRFSVGESDDRDREQLAREHYLEHGRWPGEAPAEAAAEPAEQADPAEPPRPDPHAHPGVRAVPTEPGRARAARRKRPPRRR